MLECTISEVHSKSFLLTELSIEKSSVDVFLSALGSLQKNLCSFDSLPNVANSHFCSDFSQNNTYVIFIYLYSFVFLNEWNLIWMVLLKCSLFCTDCGFHLVSQRKVNRYEMGPNRWLQASPFLFSIFFIIFFITANSTSTNKKIKFPT